MRAWREQRAGDLDLLALGPRQIGRGDAGIDGGADAGKCRPGPGAHGAEIDQDAARLAPERDIGGGIERRHQAGVLIDHGDAERERLRGRADLGMTAADEDLAGIAQFGAGEHAHQRRLAGAVLTHQGMDLAGPDIERDAPQRTHAGEALVDARDREQRLSHAARPQDLKIARSSSSVREVSAKTPSGRSGRRYFS